MFLKSYEIEISNKDGLSLTATPSLRLEMRLECPACNALHVGHSAYKKLFGWDANDSREFKINIQRAVDEVNSIKPCTSCGILSILPRSEYEDLLADLLGKVTQEVVTEKMTVNMRR